MGICWSSQSAKLPHHLTTPTSSAAPVSSALSQTTSNSTSTTVSTSLSTITQFSATSGDDTNHHGQILPASDLRNFTFHELRTATKNFRADNLLGEGGFGRVYKGCLDDKFCRISSGGGTVVAVKKLNSESLQGVEEWQSEVNFLGRLSHQNLVKLLGYCWEDEELLLVYEFMQKGSLENHIFGSKAPIRHLASFSDSEVGIQLITYDYTSYKALWWDSRIKIAVGAARGLTFLHMSNQVIYRDFKASNILLDGSYNAKISDFGLAKVGPSASKSHLTTRVMGTEGYAAPEYLATGHLYVKSDVYGFGVVLVEMLTGLRAVDNNRANGQQNLVDWIKPFLQDRRKLKTVMDRRLEAKYPIKAAFQTAKLALTCLETEPKNRPPMTVVLDTLEQIQGTSETPPKDPINRTRFAPHQAHQLPHRSPLRARQNISQVYQHSSVQRGNVGVQVRE